MIAKAINKIHNPILNQHYMYMYVCVCSIGRLIVAYLVRQL